MILVFGKVLVIKNVLGRSNLRTIKSYRNHYEVLNLKRDCSGKEIRESFLKLSKQYHPDKNKTLDSHANFVQLSEAYSILSKPESREMYDLSLSIKSYDSGQSNSNNWHSYETTQGDHAFYYNRNRAEDKFYESKPYYGIKGLKKVPNYYIVLFCMSIAGIGVSLQIFLIMKSFTLKREKILEQSQENMELLARIRKDALQNGDEKQMELLKSKLGYSIEGSGSDVD